MSKEPSSDLNILRRIADRGVKLAAEKQSEFVDLFQHMLDEITRCGNLTSIGGDKVIELAIELETLRAQLEIAVGALDGIAISASDWVTRNEAQTALMKISEVGK